MLAGLTGCLASSAPDFAEWPVDTADYAIESLPVIVTASYARGDDVYLGLEDGHIMKARDSRLDEPWQDWGQPLTVGPRLVFASSSGTLFVSADHESLYRSGDGGQTWGACLDVSVWRMDEDDEGGLYAGDYVKDDQHVATLYKSSDGGLTWRPVFVDSGNQHIHTVRWDASRRRLYIAFGDGATRGEAYSDDHGVTFHVLGRAPYEGYTDVAFTNDYVLWCTDNASGQILRVSRRTGGQEVLTGTSQYMWFGVARDTQVYVGTMTSREEGGERAVLLASADQGTTWQKLLETPLSTGPYSQGFFAESRELSAGGWLYCTGRDENGLKSYRVRRLVP